MRGIEFEVLWLDQDVVKYQVTCSNGSFCGATRMYLAQHDLSKTAQILSGFPSDIKDTRDVQLGAFEPTAAGGGIHMSFRCIDSIGHAVALVRLRADGCKGPAEPETVCLYVPVEAGSIDSFVSEARSIEARAIDDTQEAKANLRMADHPFSWVRLSLVKFSVPSWR